MPGHRAACRLSKLRVWRIWFSTRNVQFSYAFVRCERRKVCFSEDSYKSELRQKKPVVKGELTPCFYIGRWDPKFRKNWLFFDQLCPVWAGWWQNHWKVWICQKTSIGLQEMDHCCCSYIWGSMERDFWQKSAWCGALQWGAPYWDILLFQFSASYSSSNGINWSRGIASNVPLVLDTVVAFRMAL